MSLYFFVIIYVYLEGIILGSIVYWLVYSNNCYNCMIFWFYGKFKLCKNF